MVGDYATGLSKEMKNVAYRAVKEAVGEAEAVRLMRQTDAAFSEKCIKTVIRTKTTEVYNSARRSFWENDPIGQEIIVAYEFSAIMDLNTSEICSELDGKIFSREDNIDRITPPLHFNCRSLLVPVTRFEEHKTEKMPSVEEVREQGGTLKNFAQDKIG
jgi:SPP1 gp7 family putative phage head morphogenesis protein